MNLPNTIDTIAVVLAAAALALGYHRGFIVQLFSIAGLVVAYLAAYWLYDDVSPIIAGLFPMNQLQSYGKYAFLVEGLNLNAYVYNALAFALIFFAVKLGMAVVGRLLHLIAATPGLKTLNKWSGALLALFEAYVLFAIAVHAMIAIPSEPLQQTLRQSVAADVAAKQTSELTGKLREMWNRNTVSGAG
ncbi:CvpA family protein [Paenibacillus sp. GYB003]|uniref:CvpA family protein n=1 Tax=Paenibacillus sp. GYB003 TaxID=2994392 RepID=UPI002F962B17